MFLALTGAWQNLVNSLLYIKENKTKQWLGLDRFSKLRDIYMADRRKKSFIRRIFSETTDEMQDGTVFRATVTVYKYVNSQVSFVHNGS